MGRILAGLRVLMLAVAVTQLLVVAPARAEDDPDMPGVDFDAPQSTGAMPDASKLQGQLGGLEKQLSGQHQETGGPSTGRLLHIVQSLKSGGKDITAEDMGMLREYLAKMGQNSSNPELAPALEMMGQQLETLQRQRANPQDDPLKELGLDP